MFSRTRKSAGIPCTQGICITSAFYQQHASFRQYILFRGQRGRGSSFLYIIKIYTLAFVTRRGHFYHVRCGYVKSYEACLKDKYSFYLERELQ